MGRIKTIVNKNELSLAIQTAESSNTYSNRQQLAEAIANSDWAKKNKITASVAILRINEFGLESAVKTPKGKRGRQVGQTLSKEHKEAMAEGRSKPVDSKWINSLKKSTPTQYLPVINKIESGSLKSILKAKCLECSNYNTKEIKECNIISCPIWGKRPYK